QRGLETVLRVPELGRDEHLVPGEPGLPDRLAHVGLVTVHRGGVDGPIAGLQGIPDRVPGDRARLRLEDPEAEPRDLGSLVEFHPRGDRGAARKRHGWASVPGGLSSAARGSGAGRGGAKPRRGPPFLESLVVPAQLGLVFGAYRERPPRRIRPRTVRSSGVELDVARSIVASATILRCGFAEGRSVGEIVRGAHVAERTLEEVTHARAYPARESIRPSVVRGSG